VVAKVVYRVWLHNVAIYFYSRLQITPDSRLLDAFDCFSEHTHSELTLKSFSAKCLVDFAPEGDASLRAGARLYALLTVSSHAVSITQ
jgi:hypothetical protein